MKRVTIILLMTLFSTITSLWADEAGYYENQSQWMMANKVPHQSGKGLVRPVKTDSAVNINNNRDFGNNDINTIVVDNITDTVSDQSIEKDMIVYYTDADQAPTGSAYNLSSNVSGPASISIVPQSHNFGTLNMGSTAYVKFTLTNMGADPVNIGKITVNGSGFSHAGGTCSDSQYLDYGFNCTIIVKFSPQTSEGQKITGSLVLSAVTVSLEGKVGQGGNSNAGSELSFKSPSVQCPENGVPFKIIPTITNLGTSKAKDFVVKGYYSINETIGGEELFTWYVDELLTNGELNKEFTATINGYGLHRTYYVILKIFVSDADRSNNKIAIPCYLAR